MKRTIECSFCGRPEGGQYPIVEGPGVFICSDCVGICVEILKRKERAEYAKRKVSA